MTAHADRSDGPLAGRIEAVCRDLLDRIVRSWVFGTLSLIALVLMTDGPGLLRLPPVDRTEVVYAETSREMLKEGRLIGPSYLGEHERHRPIGTFWLQMAAAKLAGEGAQDRISTYRIASLLGVLGAVLATYWLLAGAAGMRAAWGAAALTAVTPIAGLQSQLAITESITFAPAIAAELALLRLYVAGEGQTTRGLAALMWAALGIGITLNALAVPVLLVATLIALLAMDRDVRWLRRLNAAWGVALMLLLGSPWMIALVMAEGGWPFAGLSINEILNLLGGSQAMKLRAWPGTFTLGFVLGFLPGVLLMWPAVQRLWLARGDDRLARFLFAWIAGYLVYLELISSKPALYTVQVMLPAAACAVMLWMEPREGGTLRFAQRVPGWPGLVFAALYPVLAVALHKVTHSPLTASMIAGALFVAVLLAMPALAARAGLATAWLATTIVGFAAFLAFTFAVLLPSQKSAWTTEVIREAVQPLKACGGISIVGYREPSAVFTFGAGNVFLSPGDLEAATQRTGRGSRYIVGEDASMIALKPKGIGCVEAFNVTRGCVQRFTVYDSQTSSTVGGKCQLDARYSCDARNTQLSGAKRCK